MIIKVAVLNVLHDTIEDQQNNKTDARRLFIENDQYDRERERMCVCMCVCVCLCVCVCVKR